MLVLPAELTHLQAQAALRMLLQGLRTQPKGDVVVDAAALTRFDSSALAVLLECRRACLAVGRAFYLHQAPQRLQSLAKLYGVAELLPAQTA
jgi:phospholipid transport system transporter-binding protein